MQRKSNTLTNRVACRRHYREFSRTQNPTQWTTVECCITAFKSSLVVILIAIVVTLSGPFFHCYACSVTAAATITITTTDTIPLDSVDGTHFADRQLRSEANFNDPQISNRRRLPENRFVVEFLLLPTVCRFWTPSEFDAVWRLLHLDHFCNSDSLSFARRKLRRKQGGCTWFGI